MTQKDRVPKLLLQLIMFCLVWISIHSLSVEPTPFASTTSAGSNHQSRREWATKVATACSLLGVPLLSSPQVAEASGLAAKLASRDPNALANSVFNVPPSAQVYPQFLRGNWQVSVKFGGFLFPSTKIPKEKLTQNPVIPGFQKCSIAALADVGKDNVQYQWKIDPTTGLEDRTSTFTSQIDNFLGYEAVKEISYNPKANPNRLSIDFVDYRTKNAERIELFFNARESEYVQENGVFVCSEYMRQVTFGGGSTVGVPRQVGGNYAHFYTWKPVRTTAPDGSSIADPNKVTGNLLTAAYLDPQDAMFFEEPSKPVAVYSHILTATRMT